MSNQVNAPTQGNGHSASFTIGYFVGASEFKTDVTLRYGELEREALFAYTRASKTIRLDQQDFKRGYFAGYESKRKGETTK